MIKKTILVLFILFNMNPQLFAMDQERKFTPAEEVYEGVSDEIRDKTPRFQQDVDFNHKVLQVISYLNDKVSEGILTESKKNEILSTLLCVVAENICSDSLTEEQEKEVINNLIESGASIDQNFSMISSGLSFEFKNISDIEMIKKKSYLRTLIPKLIQKEVLVNRDKVVALTQSLCKGEHQLKYILSTMPWLVGDFLDLELKPTPEEILEAVS